MNFDLFGYIRGAAFLGAGISMGFGAIGAALGMGYTAGLADRAISARPDRSGDIFKNMLIGQAMTETSAVFALVVAILLLFLNFGNGDALTPYALLGAGICMGFGALGSGLGSGYPSGYACQGMARQPSVTSRLTTDMLIGAAVCQTPAIFALVISFILIFASPKGVPFSPYWAALLGAGFSTGLAGIGSGIGGGMAGGASCAGIARQPDSGKAATITMLLGQAVAQTPAIFGLLVSFVLLFGNYPPAEDIIMPIAFLSAGICMGLGGIGPGIGNGLTAKEAVSWVSRNMEETGLITRTMLIAQAVAQSTAIYSLVVALVLIFVI
jgi:F-type H+-transporting ATPase subunit c